MGRTIITEISNELCPECQALYDMDINLKKITSKFDYSQTFTMPSTTNADGSTSGGGSQSFTVSFTIEDILYQCPSCKTIYDEHLTSDASSYKSKYEEYMGVYDLDPRREPEDE